ncbi:metalloprotease [Adhaeretor mobilis]|nr:hypothetical protein [Adhaeretor mobilis]
MSGNAAGSWSLSLGRWHGVELRLHLYLPLIILSAMLCADMSSAVSFRAAFLASSALVVSVCLHELMRFIVVHRVGGRTSLVVLGPTGGWSRPHLPSDPPAYLVSALIGPLTYLGLIVASACALVAHGQPDVIGLLSPLNPQITPSTNNLHLLAQLMVWVNCWLLLLNLMPVHPCDGADMLHGLLWPLVGRSSATAAMSHIAFGAAAASFVLAIVLKNQWVGGSMETGLVPAWFPLSLLGIVLLYGGNRMSRQHRYDQGLAIDELDSDDEQWLSADWLEDDRAVVLVEHLQEKQQEALDRKKRDRETKEDARVDDILAHMNEVGFDRLSEEDQAVLKRASRRYRERRHDDKV